ncbi:type II secretion system protein [Candidatus Saccharibacteria bacterium]|nr:type II secretion system protein [Candidatus Saccharibacteria bacterium]
MTNKNSKKGFTIIEVVLVLAIAGLIFLMVFIALPALQRSQRNTRRRSDMTRFVSAINDYQANNNYKLPFSGSESTGGPAVYDTKDTEWVKKYIIAGGDAEQFQDPDGTDYAFLKAVLPGSYNSDGEADMSSVFNRTAYKKETAGYNVIAVYPAHHCTEKEGTIKQASGNKFFAMVMQLEGGALNCVDNQ